MAHTVAYCIAILLLLMPSGRSAFGQAALTLDGAIAEALQNNPSLKSLGRERDAVRRERMSVLVPDNPELFAEYEGVPDGKPLSGFSSRKTGIRQRFDFPVSYVLNGRANRFEQAAFSGDILAARNEIAAEVAKSFYRVLLAERKRAEYGEMVVLTVDLLDKARIRVVAGDASPYDTLKVKVDLADIENLLRSAESEYAQTLYELKLLLGRTKGETLAIEGALTFDPVAVNADSMKARAMGTHPRLKALVAATGAKRLEVSRARWSLFPGIEIAYFSQSLPGSAEPDAWGGSLGLSIPIWGMFRERGTIEAAYLRAEAAGWRMEAGKRTVLAEVEHASAALDLARQRVELYQATTLKEVDELVRIATRSYEEGEMGYLEVAEAFRSRYRSNVGYAEALYDYNAALADLGNAVGVAATQTVP